MRPQGQRRRACLTLHARRRALLGRQSGQIRAGQPDLAEGHGGGSEGGGGALVADVAVWGLAATVASPRSRQLGRTWMAASGWQSRCGGEALAARGGYGGGVVVDADC